MMGQRMKPKKSEERELPKTGGPGVVVIESYVSTATCLAADPDC
jgi:hypothetical protein